MKVDKVVQDFRDERSIEMYGKNEIELTLQERQRLDEYIKDYNNPIWKDIIINDIKSHYKVSNIGQIKNQYNEIIKLYSDSVGYLIGFINNRNINISHPVRVHRLVGSIFIPNPESKPEINHINGNKSCNWIGNLEWNTRIENIDHALSTGLMKTKYTPKDVHNVCKLIEKGYKIKEISEELNVSKSFVIGILFRGEWSEISSKYKFPEVRSYTNEETVHEICKLLESGESISNISEKTGVNTGVITQIKNGHSWMRIANQYDIPGRIKTDHEPEKLSNKIYKLFDEGIFNSNEILIKLDLNNSEKRNSYVKYISKLKKRYNQRIECSTTIRKE